MKHPKVVLLVRIKTSLSLDEVMEVAEERASAFAAIEGLQQKYYLHDAERGEVCGLYLWESPEALASYRDSELRATVASAYRAEGEPSVEVFRVAKVLRDG